MGPGGDSRTPLPAPERAPRWPAQGRPRPHERHRPGRGRDGAGPRRALRPSSLPPSRGRWAPRREEVRGPPIHRAPALRSGPRPPAPGPRPAHPRSRGPGRDCVGALSPRGFQTPWTPPRGPRPRPRGRTVDARPPIKIKFRLARHDRRFKGSERKVGAPRSRPGVLFRDFGARRAGSPGPRRSPEGRRRGSPPDWTVVPNARRPRVRRGPLALARVITDPLVSSAASPLQVGAYESKQVCGKPIRLNRSSSWRDSE